MPLYARIDRRLGRRPLENFALYWYQEPPEQKCSGGSCIKAWRNLAIWRIGMSDDGGNRSGVFNGAMRCGIRIIDVIANGLQLIAIQILEMQFGIGVCVGVIGIQFDVLFRKRSLKKGDIEGSVIGDQRCIPAYEEIQKRRECFIDYGGGCDHRIRNMVDLGRACRDVFRRAYVRTEPSGFFAARIEVHCADFNDMLSFGGQSCGFKIEGDETAFGYCFQQLIKGDLAQILPRLRHWRMTPRG